ncbi:hypothetical protein JGS22_013010 [Streptomyces sp. P38-E01]|uniref:Uncharacterized protein n=1 Tax=Streptomyces tardus TaxID=2780544 RepID=A0A949JLP6_9ACTN|nr:hypothetical protein [Streptomyces tardus]MBU7598509.1 hypothetical protein [Streptomyces tardus]
MLTEAAARAELVRAEVERSQRRSTERRAELHGHLRSVQGMLAELSGRPARRTVGADHR